MSARTFAVLSALVASTLAQSTSVTSMFLPGFEGENIVASVMTVNPGATTYAVSCAPGTDASDCGFGPGYIIVEGPSTFGAHVTQEGSYTMDVDCSLDGQVAYCTESDAGSEAISPGTQTASVTSISDSLLPVTITSGLELLSGGSATATGTPGSSSSSASPASTASSSGASATGSPASASSSGSTTSSSTGGVPQATHNAVLAGVAALVGGAAMLA